MYIQKLREEDARNVAEFEKRNRRYFEKMVPSRSEDYFEFESYYPIHLELLNEQFRGESYFYLIRDDLHKVMGRINLVDINEESAHLGYRISEDYVGRGIATRALKLLVEEARKIPVKTIYAKTTTSNRGSQLVLERNSFRKMESTEKDEFELNGQTVEFVNYVLLLSITE